MRGAFMLLTRENDYAIRMLRSMRDGEKHTVKEICQAEEIPEAFAYKILKKLRRAGLIEVGRGASGGCRLKQPLEELNLYDVVTAVDEEPLIMPCLRESCSRNSGGSRCRVHTELAKIQGVLMKELRARKLSDLF